MIEPYSPERGQDDRPASDIPSKDGRGGALSSGAAILLIDDNPAVSRALEIAFRIAGHGLESVTGPVEAFSRLALRRYDAILLDMNFTAGESNGEQGLACLDRIMADDPGACVVVITAHSGIRIAIAAMQAGARDFAMKPWRNAELIAKVETAIARGRLPTSFSTPTSRSAGSSPTAGRKRGDAALAGSGPPGGADAGQRDGDGSIRQRANTDGPLDPRLVHPTRVSAGSDRPARTKLRGTGWIMLVEPPSCATPTCSMQSRNGDCSIGSRSSYAALPLSPALRRSTPRCGDGCRPSRSPCRRSPRGGMTPCRSPGTSRMSPRTDSENPSHG